MSIERQNDVDGIQFIPVVAPGDGINIEAIPSSARGLGTVEARVELIALGRYLEYQRSSGPIPRKFCKLWKILRSKLAALVASLPPDDSSNWRNFIQNHFKAINELLAGSPSAIRASPAAVSDARDSTARRVDGLLKTARGWK